MYTVILTYCSALIVSSLEFEAIKTAFFSVEFLCEAQWLSVDPYMRSDSRGAGF